MKIACLVLKEWRRLPCIAVALFILIPTSFLLILYVKTSSESN